MKEYKYKGFTFRSTPTLHANSMRPLYEIEDLKERGMKPFLTSIAECKAFISKYVDDGEVWTSSGLLINRNHKRFSQMEEK